MQSVKSVIAGSVAGAFLLGGVCGYLASPGNVSGAVSGQPAGAVEQSPLDTLQGGVPAQGKISCHVSNGWPIAVVRPLDEDQVWYVQDQAEQTSVGEFDCVLQFGGAATVPGARFKVAVFVARTEDEARQLTGATLRELPADRPCLGQVEVVRR